MRSLGDDAAKRVGDEGASPELESMIGRAFKADAVYRSHVDAVGDGVGALDGAPCVVLRLAEFGLLGGMPSDGGGVEQDAGAAHGRDARALRIPLVPANQRGHAARLRVEVAEAGVARSEVEFLEIKRIVRDVHLAVDAEQRAIGIDDRGGVVIETFRALLEERRDNGNVALARDARENFGGRAGDRLGEIKKPSVLLAAEILRAEQFLEADDLRALSRGFLHF